MDRDFSVCIGIVYISNPVRMKTITFLLIFVSIALVT